MDLTSLINWATHSGSCIGGCIGGIWCMAGGSVGEPAGVGNPPWLPYQD